MRITYDYIVKHFYWLTPEDLERVRKRFEEMENPAPKPTGERRGFKFDWAGGLSDLKEEYTSVELQKEIMKLWTRT